MSRPYLIPHHPGTSVMFNLKRALRQKKQKDTKGEPIYAESWSDCRPSEIVQFHR